ncbi:MAG: glycosyltransferase [Oscillospiraceae bacterium]|nr:glycosyltransferase [Oscillospiraceae bacterium]
MQNQVLSETEEFSQPLISIIVPVFNTEEYLSRCIDSILDQSHKNLDIILVNDGSTDSSGEICDRYAETDARIQVIHQANAGVSFARNTGLDNARGEWIGFVDSDDWIKPDMYAELIKAAIENNKMISCCDYIRYFSATRQEYRNQQQDNNPITMTREQSIEFSLDPKIPNLEGYAVSLILHRSLLEALNPSPLRFDTDIHYAEDWLFIIQLLIQADGIVHVPMALYFYFQREGSAIYSINERRMTGPAALRQIIKLVQPISSHLMILAQSRYARASLVLVGLLCHNKKYEDVPMFRKQARPYTYELLFSNIFSIKMKAEHMVALFFPKPVIRLIGNKIKARPAISL